MIHEVKNSLLSIAALAVLFTAGPARGAVFTTNPTLDAFVTTGPNGDRTTNNYGGAGSLSVAAPGLVDGGEFQSVLQFNLGGAVTAFDSQFGVGQWSIQSVTLQLRAAPANNAIFNSPAPGVFGISWMQNDTWQEGNGTPAAPGTTGITFSSLLGTFVSGIDEGLGTFTFNGATSGAFIYDLALTPGFTADLAAGNNVSLRLFAGDSVVSGVFNSRNSGTPANRPLLSVVAVPEPSILALAGLSLILIAGRKFSRRER